MGKCRYSNKECEHEMCDAYDLGYRDGSMDSDTTIARVRKFCEDRIIQCELEAANPEGLTYPPLFELRAMKSVLAVLNNEKEKP